MIINRETFACVTRTNGEQMGVQMTVLNDSQEANQISFKIGQQTERSRDRNCVLRVYVLRGAIRRRARIESAQLPFEDPSNIFGDGGLGICVRCQIAYMSEFIRRP